MSNESIRIGIVGLGANTRLRHVPGFRAIPGVEIVGVVNRSSESTRRAAAEFEIPRTYGSWPELIDDDDVDAVMIGTWPNLHCEITVAALQAGKHVLTEARMARDATEAHRMLAVAREHPELVAQIVPSPFGLAEDAFVKRHLEQGFLGDFRELVVIGSNDQFRDPNQPLHWRQDRGISGLNVLAMGILHEAALRWTPRPVRIFAQAQTFEPTRPGADGRRVEVTVPDSVQAVTVLDQGGRGLYHLSGTALFGPGLQLHLYGSHGTLKLEIAPQPQLWMGAAGDPELQRVAIPVEQRGQWRVEAEFIGAIRGEESVKYTDFETGVAYMEFTEAVARSAALDAPVDLPLAR